MPNWFSIGQEAELRAAGRKLFDADGQRLAALFVDEKWVVIDNHCPHQGGPIGAGQLDGRCLTCPWHGLQFDVQTGHSVLGDSGQLTTLAHRVLEGVLQVDLQSHASAAFHNEDGISRYLVRYGAMGVVGVFGTIHTIPSGGSKAVVVATSRGVELGELLREELGESSARPTGELLRVATEEDLRLADELKKAAMNDLPNFVDQVAKAGIRV